VKVQLIVRGMCCLRPGLEGISERIQVVSVVGRFLEHSRVYYFRNGGDEQVFVGSADLMPRNIDHRVEVLFPLEGEKLIREVRDELLGAYLADTAKSRVMAAGGTYFRKRSAESKKRINAQEILLARRRLRPRRPKTVEARRME
jgi:polyphosphate kinase